MFLTRWDRPQSALERVEAGSRSLVSGCTVVCMAPEIVGPAGEVGALRTGPRFP